MDLPVNKFSIVLPVRNGGTYVKECINSILAQTYPDFNILILENGSTDGTAEWISALTDPRIQIFPATTPLNIEQNWGRIVSIPKNEFMTCIGHDDIFLPDYLAEINKLITLNPQASLYQTHFDFIDAKGKTLKSCLPMNDTLYDHQFVSAILAQQIDVNGTGFITRSAAYDAMGGIPAYPNLLFADFCLWIQLCGMGYLAISPKNCFQYRIHQSMTKTSSDERFHTGFGIFMQFLFALKMQSVLLADAINTHANHFITFYCRSFAHRLLRTKHSERKNITLSRWLVQCREYSDLLVKNNLVDPANDNTIKLAQLIDRTALGRFIFLLFKKIYNKPVL